MEKIIISRTDNLGDVILTLPIAGILKKHFPNVKISFIGKSYTKPLIEASIYVDTFLDRDEILNNPQILENENADAIVFIYPDKKIAKVASKSGIKTRIGTGHRWFHWLYCNKLVSFSRKKSNLHESQLNMKLLQPLGIDEILLRETFHHFYGFEKIKPLKESIQSLIDPHKINIVFHPKSKGSAREWPIDNYYVLAQLLPADQYKIFITGTEAEGNLVNNQKPELFNLPHVNNLTGKISLEELISFIANVDGLIACSTGPLHIGSALGKNVIGIYPPMKPIHPGRWAPLGKHAQVLVLDKDCVECKKTQMCTCISSISVVQVLQEIKKWDIAK